MSCQGLLSGLCPECHHQLPSLFHIPPPHLHSLTLSRNLRKAGHSRFMNGGSSLPPLGRRDSDAFPSTEPSESASVKSYKDWGVLKKGGLTPCLFLWIFTQLQNLQTYSIAKSMNAFERCQNMLPGSLPHWHKDYFEPKAMEKKQRLEDISVLPASAYKQNMEKNTFWCTMRMHSFRV